MHRTTKIATKIGASAAIAAVALIATATAANAATLNPDGTGFVGKGEVQSAYGLNNRAIQKIIDANEKAFTFTSSQPATQSLTSTASQVVTEHATQTAHRVLSCTVTVGGVKNPRVFEADGTRDGIKTGSREGNRTGDRVGTLDGTLAASIDAKARKTGQWTGWNLKGFTSGPSFTATGAEYFDAPEYGDPSFTGGYAFGDVEWSGWQAEPGTNPADCLRNDNGAEIDRPERRHHLRRRRAHHDRLRHRVVRSDEGHRDQPDRAGPGVRHLQQRHQAADDHGACRLIRPHHSSPRPTRVGGCFMQRHPPGTSPRCAHSDSAGQASVS